MWQFFIAVGFILLITVFCCFNFERSMWESVRSVLTVIGDTAINGTMNYIANKGAAELVPTNSGWFIPKKFLSYFTKSYGQKMMAQTAISGGISNILNLFMRLIKGIQ